VPIALYEAGPSAKAPQFREAVAWFQGRQPITKEEWSKLEVSERRNAFAIAGIANLELSGDVLKGLEKAHKEGKPFKDFQKEFQERLEKEWAGTVKDPSARMETIFRNWIQGANNAGRYEQATNPDALAVRPYWKFVAVLDVRTSVICKECNGVILPAGHPWWKTHIGPLHHRCRSSFITLTKKQAEKAGITAEPPSIAGDDGFGNAPEPDKIRVTIEISQVPVELQTSWIAKKEEELREGKHLGRIDTSAAGSTITETDARAVVEGVRHRDLAALTEKAPIDVVRFARVVRAEAQTGVLEDVGGAYHDKQPTPTGATERVIAISTSVDESALGAQHETRAESRRPLHERTAPQTASAVGVTVLESLTRTFAHEVGHHVHVTLDEAFRAGTVKTSVEQLIADAWTNIDRIPVTLYANEGRHEYFCECLATYLFDRSTLNKLDPVGYSLVEEVLRLCRTFAKS
jgi:SPP1 gp7 family putative phage head morphogenesis protein